MVSEEAIQKVKEAFRRVQRESDLQGLDLDDQIMSPFFQESGTTKLTVCLLRGESERTSIVVDPVAVARREGALTISGLAEEVRRVLYEQGILAE